MTLNRLGILADDLMQCVQCHVANVVVAVDEETAKNIDGEDPVGGGTFTSRSYVARPKPHGRQFLSHRPILVASSVPEARLDLNCHDGKNAFVQYGVASILGGLCVSRDPPGKRVGRDHGVRI